MTANVEMKSFCMTPSVMGRQFMLAQYARVFSGAVVFATYRRRLTRAGRLKSPVDAAATDLERGGDFGNRLAAFEQCDRLAGLSARRRLASKVSPFALCLRDSLGLALKHHFPLELRKAGE